MTELGEREGGDEPAFEELYDEMTLRRLGLDPEVRPSSPVPRPTDDGATGPFDDDAVLGPARDEGDGDDPADGGDGGDWGSHHPVRRRMAGAMLAGAMLGLGEILEPEKPKEAVTAPELLGEPPLEQPVQFILVPGLPKASVVILRPWLRRRAAAPGHPADAEVDIAEIGS